MAMSYSVAMHFVRGSTYSRRRRKENGESREGKEDKGLKGTLMEKKWVRSHNSLRNKHFFDARLWYPYIHDSFLVAIAETIKRHIAFCLYFTRAIMLSMQICHYNANDWWITPSSFPRIPLSLNHYQQHLSTLLTPNAIINLSYIFARSHQIIIDVDIDLCILLYPIPFTLTSFECHICEAWYDGVFWGFYVLLTRLRPPVQCLPYPPKC